MGDSAVSSDLRAYEELRKRLVDRTRRNRLLNYWHSGSALVRIVDESPELVASHLLGGGAFRFRPLPDPDDQPQDERTATFRAALGRSRTTDPAYLSEIRELGAIEGATTGAKAAQAERKLRDRQREQSGMPPRPSQKGIDVDDWARQHGIDPSLDAKPPGQELLARGDDEFLQTLLFPNLLQAHLAKLQKNAAAIEQETGVGTLHLAIGFLEWFDSESSDKAWCSPLLLLPVALKRETKPGLQDSYSLSALDTTLQANLSLELLLRETHGFALPAYEADGTAPVEIYLGAVAAAVAPFARWRVRRFLTLAPFSFARIAMYRDLDPAHWPDGDPSAHDLVRAILRQSEVKQPEPGGEDTGRFAAEHDIDDPKIEREAPYLVQDADSSQHSAIIDAMRGRTFVIEGPPGTGKSQTIVNLIANAIAAGKRVLFVAEKLAALKVVKKRLEHAKLGHLCLSLHSEEARPATVIKALRERDGMQPSAAPGAEAAAANAGRAKAELRRHLDALHAERGPHRETLHALIGRLAELGRVLPLLPALLRNSTTDLPPNLDGPAVLMARSRLEALEDAGTPMHRPDWEPRRSPFAKLARHDLFPWEQDTMFALLAQLAEAADRLATRGLVLAASLAEATPRLARLRDLVVTIGEIADPAPAVDRTMLDRITLAPARAVLREAASQADKLASSANILLDAGLVRPAEARAELLDAAAGLAGRLTLDAACVADVPDLAEQASQAHEQAQLCARAVADLVAAFQLELDPRLEHLRAALQAIGLAAELDPAVAAHRRPGLDRHADVLATAADRLTMLRQQECEITAVLETAHSSATMLRRSAGTLRTAGIAGFLSAEVRAARRVFAAHWRGGRAPPRREWPVLLERAATFLDARAALRDDPALRAALGDTADCLTLDLRGIAAAAGWQRRVRDTLGADGARLRTMLDAADAERLRHLASLADLATALRAFLGSDPAASRARWSARLAAAESRAKALTALVEILARLALNPELPVENLGAIAAACRRYQGACAWLAGPDARRVLADVAPDAACLSATAAFADAIAASLPGAAVSLLADDWTATIQLLRADAAEVRAALTAFDEPLNALEVFGFAPLCAEWETQPPAVIATAARALCAARGELTAWLGFAATREACREDPLAQAIVRAVEPSAAPLRHLSEAIDWLVAWTIVRRAAERDRPAFRQTGPQLDAFRRAFRAADHELQAIAAGQVAAAAMRRPVPPGHHTGPVRTRTERALLDNQYARTVRFVPVRDLLDRAGQAVLALTPCLMMSPLTVAQFLKPGRLRFDLVIMDEASQIRPEDAIGALLRATRAVVVGDPHQLPPTDFFQRALDDDGADDDDAGQTDAKSVLDLAMLAFRPARRLRWHYRSQHESLIALSNKEFYDRNLLIFPAAAEPSETLGIEFVQVGGVWHQRVNPQEARAIAEAVAGFMHRHPTLSHGVVTMNLKQRDLVEQEIERLTTGDGAANDYREHWENQHEPSFVKNLENVQGDERDVIFISLGWGRPPQGGPPHQRFTQINRADGHRRLNVLFTRAKRKIVLFASLQPEDIKVDPTKDKRGVRVLRDYLLYARDGRLEGGNVDADVAADSPFEVSVANALRARGYDIALQVGVAGYRIDLAVRHPEFPSRLVLGIECDGATYHRAKSARDRDRLRQEALERLGWRLARVWSTDWFQNPIAQTDRLVGEIGRAIAADAANAAQRARLVEIADPAAIAGEAAEPAAPVGEIPPPGHDLVGRLADFRAATIMRDLPGSEPNRCILRDEMIAAIVACVLDDEADFYGKIPERLRTRTDGRQMRYLSAICEIVAADQDGQHHRMQAPATAPVLLPQA